MNIKLSLFILTIGTALMTLNPCRAENNQFPETRVSNFKGSPCLFINNKPLFPMILFEQEVCAKDAKTFQDAGVKLYSFIERVSFLDLGWIDDYKSDFSIIDRVLKVNAERCPKGYLIPRIHLWAPGWWINKYPKETFKVFNKDGKYRRSYESFTSELWKEQAGKALKRMIKHIMQSPYAKRVAGLTISAGESGEWHQFGYDDSPSMLKYFRNYLKKKYNNDLKLFRKNWNNDQITFDNAQIPNKSEREKCDYGIFKDPAKGRQVMDYNEAYHRSAVEAIDYFTKIAKEESNNKLFTIVLYGYMPDMHWSTKHIHHRAAAMSHKLKYVDAFASPHSYYRRGPGQDGILRNYPASLALHNKLFIDEADDRTHLSFPKNFATLANNLDESIQTLNRSFGNVVTANCGMWYMDHTSGKWYDDPKIRENFKKINQWANYSMTLPRKDVAEVAVISQAESEFYIGGKLDWTANMYESRQGQNQDLAKAGAPFSRYFVEDLEDGLVPECKVYIFLDCFYLNDKQRKAIEKLKRDNKTLIWLYAPGFIENNALSLSAMEKLTGIKFKTTTPGTPEVLLNQPTWDSKSFGLPANMDKFMKKSLNPRFTPVSKGRNVKVWGRYADNKKTAMISKKFKDWRSIYVPMTPIPASLLRKIYRKSGVHIYASTNDPISVNSSWICLTASKAGKKIVKLPKAMDVYNLTKSRFEGRKVKHFYLNMRKNETSIIAIGKNLKRMDKK